MRRSAAPHRLHAVDDPQPDITVEPQELIGRRIVAAEICRDRFADWLRIALDDGRVVDIGGYTGTFDGDSHVTVRPATESRDDQA